MILKLIASIICGSILSLSQPGFDLWFLAWIFLAPLFILINTSKKMLEVILFAGLFGFFYNAISLNWLLSLHPLTWLGLSYEESLFVSVLALLIPAFCNSLYFILFGILVFVMNNRAPSPYNNGFLKYLLLSIFWIIIFNKISSSKLLLGFPWTLIEYSQYKILPFIQIAEYFGSLFIGFILVMFAQVIADIFLNILNRERIGGRYLPKHPGNIEETYFGLLFILVLVIGIVINGKIAINNNEQSFTLDSKTILV
ncbi:MAG: hypothetical protein HYR97_09145, partial [Candidatus Melainabacteria bacterium]|nr:hypothetical protein [Candidatus Melainabacteria bacterium]